MSAPSPAGPPPAGRIRHARHGHVLQITIDNPRKTKAFTPEMVAEPAEAMTLLDQEEP